MTNEISSIEARERRLATPNPASDPSNDAMRFREAEYNRIKQEALAASRSHNYDIALKRTIDLVSLGFLDLPPNLDEIIRVADAFYERLAGQSVTVGTEGSETGAQKPTEPPQQVWAEDTVL